MQLMAIFIVFLLIAGDGAMCAKPSVSDDSPITNGSVPTEAVNFTTFSVVDTTSTKWKSETIIIYIMCHDESSCHSAEQSQAMYPSISKVIHLPHTIFFETAIYREYLFYNFEEWKDKLYVGT